MNRTSVIALRAAGAKLAFDEASALDETLQ